MTKEQKSKLLNKAANIVSQDKFLILYRIIMNDIHNDEDYYQLLSVLSIISTLNKQNDDAVLYLNKLIKKTNTYDEQNCFIFLMIYLFTSYGNMLLTNLEKEAGSSDEVKAFITKIKRTAELMESGLTLFEASSLADTEILNININGKDTRLVSFSKADDTYGFDDLNDLLIFKRIINKTTGKKFLIIFKLNNKDYIRYIGEEGSTKFHAINKRGTYEEFKNMRVTLRVLDPSNTLNYDKVRKETLLDVNAKTKQELADYNCVKRVYDELAELAEEKDGITLAEHILTQKSKKLKLQ